MPTGDERRGDKPTDEPGSGDASTDASQRTIVHDSAPVDGTVMLGDVSKSNHPTIAQGSGIAARSIAHGSGIAANTLTGSHITPVEGVASRRGRRKTEPPLVRGALVGRYVVIDKLGAGGMGVVYTAYDPNLNRRVALKLVRGAFEGARARFEREAQALARLSHPNVVAIYDFGTLTDVDGVTRLFLAMEMVEGTTLSDWLRAEPRPWREVVKMFIGAGRGLAAAHAADLIHRDFKPGNVLVGEDGRVRVLDFGLARGVGQDDEPSWVEDLPPAPGRDSASDVLDMELTRPGIIMGTPVYMPPEAYLGEQVTALGDQFSFCVALHEGLYGARPFNQESIDGKLPHPPPPAPADTDVPTWVRRVVLRGLEERPEARFPSMDALLAALEDDPAIRRRKWLLAGGAAVTLSVAIVGAMYLRRPTVIEAVGPCSSADPLSGIWDAPTRGKLDTQFTSTGDADARDAFANAANALDETTARWRDARRTACASVRGAKVRVDRAATTEIQAIQWLRLDCLDRQRDDLAAVVEVLQRADAAMAKQAAMAVRQLPSPAMCDNPRSQLYITPPPPEAASRAVALRKRISTAQALILTGKEREAGDQLKSIDDDARKLGYPPLLAEALYLRGNRRLGDFATAIAHLDEAERVALASRADAIGARAAALRLREAVTAGYDNDKLRDWTERARAWIQRDEDLEAQFTFEQSVGILAASRGDYAVAETHLLKSIDLGSRAFGPVNTRVAGVESSLGFALIQLGRYEDAVRLLGGSVERFERAYGTTSLRLRNALDNYGLALAMLGRFHDARRALEKALAISKGVHDIAHGAALCDLARVLLAEGDVQQAIVKAEEGVELHRKLGVQKLNLAINMDPLAEAYSAAGRHDDALRVSRECIAEFSNAGNTGVDTVACRTIEAAASIDRGQPAEAIPLLENAISIQRDHATPPGALAVLQFQLARALVAMGRDRDKARELATTARTELAKHPFRKRSRDELEAWWPKAF